MNLLLPRMKRTCGKTLLSGVRLMIRCASIYVCKHVYCLTLSNFFSFFFFSLRQQLADSQTSLVLHVKDHEVSMAMRGLSQNSKRCYFILASFPGIPDSSLVVYAKLKLHGKGLGTRPCIYNARALVILNFGYCCNHITDYIEDHR